MVEPSSVPVLAVQALRPELGDKENAPELLKVLRLKDENAESLQRALDGERQRRRLEKAQAVAEKAALQDRWSHAESDLQEKLLALEAAADLRAEEHRSRLLDLTTQLDAAKFREEELTDENAQLTADLRRLLTRAEVDSAELLALGAKCDALTAEVQASLATLKTSDEVREGLLEEIKEHEETIRKVRADLHDLHAVERSSREHSQAQYERLSAQCEALTRQVQDRAKEADVAQERVHRMEEQLKAKDLAAERDRREAEDRRRDLEQRLAKSQEEVTAQRDEIRARTLVEAKLQESIATLETRIQDHKAEESRLQQEIFKLQTLSDERQLLIQSGERRESHLQEQVKALEERLKVVLAESESRQTALLAAKGQILSLELELTGAKDATAAARREMERIRAAEEETRLDVVRRSQKKVAEAAGFSEEMAADAAKRAEEKVALREEDIRSLQLLLAQRREELCQKEDAISRLKADLNVVGVQRLELQAALDQAHQDLASATCVPVAPAPMALAYEVQTQMPRLQEGVAAVPEARAVQEVLPAPDQREPRGRLGLRQAATLVQAAGRFRRDQPQQFEEAPSAASSRRGSLQLTSSAPATRRLSSRSAASEEEPLQDATVQRPSQTGKAQPRLSLKPPTAVTTSPGEGLQGGLAAEPSAPVQRGGPSFQRAGKLVQAAGRFKASSSGQPQPAAPAVDRDEEPPEEEMERQASEPVASRRRSSAGSQVGPVGPPGQDVPPHFLRLQAEIADAAALRAQVQVVRLREYVADLLAYHRDKVILLQVFLSWSAAGKVAADRASLELALTDELRLQAECARRAAAEDEGSGLAALEGRRLPEPTVAGLKRLVTEYRHRVAAAIAEVVEGAASAGYEAQRSEAFFASALAEHLRGARSSLGRWLHGSLFLYQKLRTLVPTELEGVLTDPLSKTAPVPFYVLPYKVQLALQRGAASLARGEPEEPAASRQSLSGGGLAGWLAGQCELFEARLPLSASDPAAIPSFMARLLGVRGQVETALSGSLGTTVGPVEASLHDRLDKLLVDAATIYMSGWRSSQSQAAAPAAAPWVYQGQGASGWRSASPSQGLFRVQEPVSPSEPLLPEPQAWQQQEPARMAVASQRPVSAPREQRTSAPATLFGALLEEPRVADRAGDSPASLRHLLGVPSGGSLSAASASPLRLRLGPKPPAWR